MELSKPNLELADALRRALPPGQDLEQLLKYLCTQGNNEEIYKSIIADIFEFELKSTNAFVITESVRDTKKNIEERRLVSQLKTGSGFKRRSDIYIVEKRGSQEKHLHVIEIKSNRHGHFFYKEKVRREKPFPESIREPQYQDILDDVEVLHSQKEIYAGARFWICVILYSFNCEIDEKYPENYPRYWKEYESKQDLRKISPFNQSAFDLDCDEKRKIFTRNLVHLINESRFDCRVDIERVFQATIVKGEHRSVFVRSDIVLVEVNFQ
jgi:hypothetical protein